MGKNLIAIEALLAGKEETVNKLFLAGNGSMIKEKIANKTSLLCG